MRLDLRKIIHVPGASMPFDFPLDLTHLDFYGVRPVTQPVQVRGKVTNRAGALLLEGTASTVLDLTCDRCCKSCRDPYLGMDHDIWHLEHGCSETL